MDNFIIYNLEERNGQLNPIDNDIISQWINHEKAGKKIIICTNKNVVYAMGIMMYYNKPETLREFLEKENLDNFRFEWKDNSICIMPKEISYDEAIVWISKNEN